MRSRHSSFTGTHEALSVRIAVRRFWRNRDDVDVILLHNFSKLRSMFRISVDDEIRVTSEKAVVERSDVERNLFHEDSVRVWRGRCVVCMNAGNSMIPLILRFLPQKRNLLIPLGLSGIMQQRLSDV